MEVFAQHLEKKLRDRITEIDKYAEGRDEQVRNDCHHRAIGVEDAIEIVTNEVNALSKEELDKLKTFNKITNRLMKCFKGSFINYKGEYIVHRASNTYFVIDEDMSEVEVKCKVLEWLSRAASKGQPYDNERQNTVFREWILKGINEFLQTCFSQEQIILIYTHLGNAVNHNKTIKFIESNYDFSLLENKEA